MHWWRNRTHGAAAAEEAVRRGHQVIASPNNLCYLSFPVDPDENFRPERTFDLAGAYAAQYVPQELTPEQSKQVIGAQACCWTEHLSEDDIYAMLFPRILACAELMWRYPEHRDFDAFYERVRVAELEWRALGVEYGPAFQRSDR